MLPQPATETFARAPEPWCVIGGPRSVIRDAVSLLSCARNTVQGPRLLDHGALLRAPGSCALGDFIGICWKGTRISAYLAKHLCCFDAAARMWRLREWKSIGATQRKSKSQAP